MFYMHCLSFVKVLTQQITNICPGAVNEAREANLNEITEVQQSLQETKDTIAALKNQLNEIHEHDAVLK